jgi:hypothetical protein
MRKVSFSFEERWGKDVHTIFLADMRMAVKTMLRWMHWRGWGPGGKQDNK